MREQGTNRRDLGYLSYRGLYWRSITALLVFQALGWGSAAWLAYLIARPELAANYFGAHQALRSSLRLLAPALAVSAGIGFLVVGVGSALSLWRYSRRLREPLFEIDGLLRGLAAGRIPVPGPATRRVRATDEAAVVLEPLRVRLLELQRVSRGIQKIALEVNYRAGSSGDLRGIAGQLDVLAKELNEAVGWFEG